MNPVQILKKFRGKGHFVFVFIEVFGCEGGIQSYIQDVLTAFDHLPQAATADIFLLRDAAIDPAVFASPRIRFHTFKSPQMMRSRIRMSLALATHLIWYRPERVFCGHINLVRLVSQLCRWLALPYTVLTYGKEVWYPLSKPEKTALTRAQRVWTISRYSGELMSQANGVDPARIQLLPCVVDGERFTPAPPNEALQTQYGLKGAQVLMTVARLWPGDIYKGVDVTIRALPAIATHFPNIKYLVIGRGDDQPRLAALADSLGVADRVIFAGFVPTDALVEHYRLATVYVMPSKEGFGIVYLEAMACEVPVISGDDDGSADPLQDGRLGWRVPHREPEAVAAACIAALKGQDQRCEGTWLRQEALAAFSAPALAKRLDELLAS
jgi:phosphatidyl-myo-inositol dimannoside synthase